MNRNRLNCVLLIDDNPADNYLHELIIDEAGCAERVVAVENGKEALAFLTADEGGEPPQPELILLDIHMPVMDGWQFLEQYEKLEQAHRGGVVLVMLTTSLMPSDEAKAAGFDGIRDYASKPLTMEGLFMILEQYFPQRFPGRGSSGSETR